MIWLGLLIFVRLPSTAHTEKYHMLPPIYEIEDYVTCFKRDDTYCKIDVKLKNHSDKNVLWDLIKESINDNYSHDRSIIHRGVCVPKKESKSLKTTKIFLMSHLKQKLHETNLLPHIEDILCDTKDIVFTSYDILLMVFFIAYISFVLYASIYDLKQKRLKHENHGNETVLSFSLVSNWKKMCNTEGNEDYNKLKSIQGVRFYNMILIISFHTLYSSSLIYISNPEEIGTFFHTGVLGAMDYAAVLFSLLVQTFFLISSWIITFQIYNRYKEHGRFTVKEVCIVLINRFFRLGVCNTIALSVAKFSAIKFLQGPITFDVIQMSRRACAQNWWYTFFFINNHLNPRTICVVPSWYLSVDFQLYTMIVITLYFIFKFKLSEKAVVGFLLIFSYILYGTSIYVNKMGILFIYDTKTCCIYCDHLPASKLYFSTISNLSTGIVGLGLGILYTKIKNRHFSINRIVSMIWLLLFFGLPFTVIMIAQHELSGTPAALVGPLLKPMFSLGIGVGILGMSHNIGGFIKRACENKYVVIMSNFSYSTYIFQSIIIFLKGIGSYSLMQFGFSQMVKSFLFVDLPMSILLGVLGALIFEQPGVNLQKMILPQLPRGRNKQQKDR